MGLCSLPSFDSRTRPGSSPRFEQIADTEVFGTARIHAVGGGPLEGTLLFRSRSIHAITAAEAFVISTEFGIRSIYDLRNQWEIADQGQSYLLGATTLSLAPSFEKRRKNARFRLTAGAISEYGKPEERMTANYRRYANNYPAIGKALRTMSLECAPSLIHCVNGKDRTGILCALIQRIAGCSPDDIMSTYLLENSINKDLIDFDCELLGQNMTDQEKSILMSFLEARPAYLEAFFNEINSLYGTFYRYVREGLRLDAKRVERINRLLHRSI